MKNRIFTILLVLVVFCSCNVLAQEKNYNTEAMQTIKELGFFDIKEGFSFDDEMNRGEFAYFLSQMFFDNKENAQIKWEEEYFVPMEFKYDKPDSSLKIDFLDVTKENEYYDAISNVVWLGLMNGSTDNNFMAEKGITKSEIAKVMVTVLGYYKKAEIKGGYPKGYIYMANELKLFDNLQNNNDYLTNADVANIIYKSFNVKLLTLNSIVGDKNYFVTQNDENLLSKYLNIYCIEGMVVQNEVTSITTPDAMKLNSIKIKDVVIDLGESDYGKYIGRYLKVYYQKDKKSDRNTLKTAFISKKDLSFTVDATDIDCFKKNVLNFKETYKKRSIKIPKGTPILKNGTAVSSYDETIFEFQNGNITFVTQDGSNVEVVIIESYVDCYVSSFEQNSKKIHNKLNNEIFNFDRIDYKYDITTQDGEKCELNDITKDMVLSIADSTNYTKIIICQKKIKGKLNELLSDKKIRIDDKTYEISSEFYNSKNRKDFSVGDNVTVHLNAFERISWIDYEAKSRFQLGYIVRTSEKNLGFVKKANVYFVLPNGTYKDFLLNDEFNISNSENIQQKYDLQSSIVPFELLKGIVRFRLNDENEISDIELPLNTTNNGDYEHIAPVFITSDDENDNNYYKKYDYKASVRTFGGQVYINNNTFVLYEPNGGSENEYDYSLVDIDKFKYDTAYKIKAYSSAPNTAYADVLIVNDKEFDTSVKASISTDTKAMIVTKISQAVDEKGETVKKVTGLLENSPKIIYGDYNFTKGSNNVTAFEIAKDPLSSKTDGNVNTYEIQCGDIIRYATDPETGYVTDVQLILRTTQYNNSTNRYGVLVGTSGKYEDGDVYTNPYSISRDGINLETQANRFNKGAFRVLYGDVYSSINSILKVTTKNVRESDFDINNISEEYIIENYLQSSFKTTIVTINNNENVEAKAGNSSDIRTYQNCGGECSEIVATMRYGDPLQIFIINRN